MTFVPSADRPREPQESTGFQLLRSRPSRSSSASMSSANLSNSSERVALSSGGVGCSLAFLKALTGFDCSSRSISH